MLLLIKLFMSSVWSYLLPSLKIYATAQGVAMANSAIKAVRFAVAVEGTGTDKRKAAVKYVMDDMKAMNFAEVAKNLVYGAVVSAYEKEYSNKVE